MKKIIETDLAPGAIGPYSQAIAIEAGELVFTAGQLGLDPKTGDFVPGGIKNQTKQALENIKAIIQKAGTNMQNVVKTTVFLQNLDDFAIVNDVFASYFDENPPARSAVQVARLPKDGLVEIEAIAIIKKK